MIPPSTGRVFGSGNTTFVFWNMKIVAVLEHCISPWYVCDLKDMVSANNAWKEKD